MRRIGSEERKRKTSKARRRNRPRKVRERASRDARMLTAIQGGSLPYTPWVMSWLSTKLDKKSTSITQEDVNAVFAPAAS